MAFRHIFSILEKGMDKFLLFSIMARMPILVLLSLEGTYLAKYVIELISDHKQKLIYFIIAFR